MAFGQVREGGHSCDSFATDQTIRTMRRALFIFLLLLILGLGLYFYFRFSWVFGEGAKSGELNFVVYKGWLWKTYEGRLIQTGIKGQAGTMQSNEFNFSVEDPEVAEQLMVNSGKVFNLHYVEYQGALPWRGQSPYVVDSIISMSNGMNAAGQVVP